MLYVTMRSLRHSLIFLVLTTAGSGFLLGSLIRPNWQVAVESAQVLAGVVPYPPHNSFHIYHVKLWTMVNQLLALPLALGSSELVLSILVSGGIAALSFAAVGVCTFAASRDTFWSIAAAFLLNFSSVRDALAVNYPMDFMGTPHTYGVVALAWNVTTLSLLALERYTIAGVFLGLAPAAHPSMGLWSWLVAIVALAWHGRDSLRIVRKLFRSTAIGLSVSAASFVLQLAWMRPVLPDVDASTRASYVSAWVRFFDFHRRPVDFSLPGVELALAAIVIGLYLIPFLDDDDDFGSVLLLRTTIVAAVFALIGAGVSRLPPSSVPPGLLMLMPTRLFLLSNLLFIATLFGLLRRFQSVWVQLNALFLVVALAIGSATLAIYGLILSGIAFMVWKSVTIGDHKSRFGISRWIAVLAGGVVLAVSIRGFSNDVRSATAYRNWMADRTNNPVLTLASRTKGLIAIGTQCCAFTQMRTRRPLLVETMALDQIMYAPESAPDMNAALKAVYGVDLLNPAATLKSPAFDEDLTPVTRPLWESRTPEEWKALATTFGFTVVLANPNWKLQLPELARDSSYALYEVWGQ